MSDLEYQNLLLLSDRPLIKSYTDKQWLRQVLVDCHYSHLPDEVISRVSLIRGIAGSR